MPGLADGPDQRRELVLHPPRAHPRDQRQPARRPLGIEPLAGVDEIVGGRRRPDLEAQWVSDAREELDVGAVRLARPVADPQHVRRAVVPLAGQRVAAGEALLVVEEQALVARPHVDLVQSPLRHEVDAARRHEPQRALDLGGDRLVAAPLRGCRDELLVPAVDARQVGEAPLRERPQEVQRRGRLVVGLHHPVGVGDACRRGGRVVVHHVAAEGGELDPVDRLGRRRAGLRELPGDPAQLDHRQRAGVGHHGRHLEDDLELLADRDRREVGERLRAVTGLEQEGAALRDGRQGAGEVARLAGEDERRVLLQTLGRSGEARLVGPVRLLLGGKTAPGGGRPGVGGGGHGGWILPRGGSLGSCPP